MEKNDFSVDIVGYPTFPKNGYKYIALPHETEYKLRLSNKRNTRCDVQVKIDGRIIGTFRVNALESMIIERPADNDRKFVFLKENTKESLSAGIVTGNNNNGLIEVTFTPELSAKRCCNIQQSYLYNTTGYMSEENFESSHQSNRCYSSGATALGQKSDQSFDYISKITNVDHSNITTIILRLVCDDDYLPYEAITNYKANHPVPPRIDF